MTIEQIANKHGFATVTKCADTSRGIKSAYCCDLLSWVMSHGTADMALITIHTHMNVIAIAALLEMSCIIIPENIEIEESVINKADEEGICILKSQKSAYEISGLLFADGILPAVK